MGLCPDGRAQRGWKSWLNFRCGDLRGGGAAVAAEMRDKKRKKSRVGEVFEWRRVLDCWVKGWRGGGEARGDDILVV